MTDSQSSLRGWGTPDGLRITAGQQLAIEALRPCPSETAILPTLGNRHWPLVDSFFLFVTPFAVLQIRLERLDNVIEWEVYSPQALAELGQALAAGVFGPARILKDTDQAQLAAA